VASCACWTCTRNCLGVPCDHTGTHNSTLWGRMSFEALAVVSSASWMTSFLGMYGMCSLWPTFLLHSWGLSPLRTALDWPILLRATQRHVSMKRALKKLLGVPFRGVLNLCLDKRSFRMPCNILFVCCRHRAGWQDGVEEIIFAVTWGGCMNWLSIDSDLCHLLLKKHLIVVCR
jgi:hypothetical protein